MEEEKVIQCLCDDPSCKRDGHEGEVAGHIEECSCHHCHHEMGKVSDSFTSPQDEETKDPDGQKY